MKNFDDIISLAKRRGFVYPSSEIFGGLAGVYDYGPIGALFVKKIKDSWHKVMVQVKRDIVPLDSGIAMHHKVWESSGHTENFCDPYVVCSKTMKKFRADHLLEEIDVECENLSLKELQSLFSKHRKDLKPEGCNPMDLSIPSYKNLLVESNLGADTHTTYLRGETCQGIYINFKNVVDTSPVSIPFGIAQIGKAFRNEISPRQFLFRTREFEQMEMQYFTKPKDAERFFDEFFSYRFNHLLSIGLKKESLREREHSKLVFYAKKAKDIEFSYPFGWGELEGVHNRGDYDLNCHSKSSGVALNIFDEEEKKHYTPHVVETSIGVGRLFLALFCDAYTVEELPDGTSRTVLKFAPHIAPIGVCVLPLQKKKEMVDLATKIHSKLSQSFSASYDETQSIGRRYRRQDELGTPLCVTVDFDSLEDDTVTVRDRDSMEQERVSISSLLQYVEKKISDSQELH